MCFETLAISSFFFICKLLHGEHCCFVVLLTFFFQVPGIHLFSQRSKLQKIISIRVTQALKCRVSLACSQSTGGSLGGLAFTKQPDEMNELFSFV